MDTTAPSSSATGAVRANNRACAACKYQRKRCKPDCVLAPYFPADIPQRFVNVHNLFGVSNILRLIRGRNGNERNIMMGHLIYQADRRAADPVGGCYREILHLQILNDEATVRLAELTKIRDSQRAPAAAGTQPIFDSQNALPGPAFDGENVLPGPVFDDIPPHNQQLLPQEGRAEDHNHEARPWDLIEAFLMDNGDEEDQTPMNFSGVQEHQQPLPQEGRADDHNDLLGGGGNGCVVDLLPSTSTYPSVPCDLIEAILMDDGDEEDQTPMNFSGVQERQQPTPLSTAARGGEWQDQASTSCEWAPAKM